MPLNSRLCRSPTPEIKPSRQTHARFSLPPNLQSRFPFPNFPSSPPPRSPIFSISSPMAALNLPPLAPAEIYTLPQRANDRVFTFKIFFFCFLFGFDRLNFDNWIYFLLIVIFGLILRWSGCSRSVWLVVSEFFVVIL